LDFKFLYLLNWTLEHLEYFNLIFLIGCDLRYEAPLILTRIRKSFLNNKSNFNVYSLGLAVNNFSFFIRNLGNSLKTYKNFLEGKIDCLGQNFLVKISLLNINFFYKKFIFFFGMGILIKIDIFSFIKSFLFSLPFFFKYKNEYLKYLNIITTNLGILSGFEFNLITFKKKFTKQVNLFYFINSDFYNNLYFNDNFFIIYQHSFVMNNIVYNKANIILPSSVYLEKTSSYINLEGRYRFAKQAIIPFKFVYNDADIIQVLSVLRKFKILDNFSIINKFFDILNFFNFLINYECLFFFNITSFYLNLQKKF
jgi:hypothetical protein